MPVIQIDLRCLQDPGYSARGIGQVTRSLLRFLPHFAPPGMAVIGLIGSGLPPLSDADRDLVHGTAPTGIAPRDLAVFVQPSPMTHRPDAVVRPLRDRAAVKAAVIYDFIPFDEPNRYLSARATRLEYYAALAALPAYDLYFPLSKYTASRLFDLVQVEAARVFTIGAPVRPGLTPPATPPAGKPYFLCVAGDDWRKNVECPIAAFAELARPGRADIGLVIVGGYSKARQGELLSRFPVTARHQVLFADRLADAELAALYAGAVATICPSRLEGFSLPVVEALACGSPVLAANCAAQAELLPDADSLFSPHDSRRLASLMTALLDDPARRAALLSRQRPAAAPFTEQAVAERFWKPIFARLGAHAVAAPTPLRGRRPRLAFVTPMPPETTGVAAYSARTLPALARLADVDVFTDAPDAASRDGYRFGGPISSVPYVSRRYDRVISVIGNSRFHSRIVDYLRDFGGACIAHDARMADFYFHLRDIDLFLSMAERGMKRRPTRDEAAAALLTPELFGTLFFDEFIGGAFPILVHSPMQARNLKEIYGVGATALPFSLIHEFADETLGSSRRADARARLGIAPATLALMTFGAPAPSKGNIECIEAVAALRDRGVDAALYFVGETNSYAAPLSAIARASRAGAHIHFTPGRPDDDAYRDYLVAADIGIQLRSHGLGGLSAALLDCISAGLPTVASADLAAAMDAPSYIATVPVRAASGEVAERIAELIAAPRPRLSAERAAYNAAHSQARYARELMAALGLETQNPISGASR